MQKAENVNHATAILNFFLCIGIIITICIFIHMVQQRTVYNNQSGYSTEEFSKICGHMIDGKQIHPAPDRLES